MRSLNYAEDSSNVPAGIGGREDRNKSIGNNQQLIDIQMKVDDIRDVRKFGGGAFGVVHLVEYYDKFYASKRVSEERVNAEVIQNFIEKIKLVALLEHPNVLRVVGAAWTKRSNFQALLEYLENGEWRLAKSPSGEFISPRIE